MSEIFMITLFVIGLMSIIDDIDDEESIFGGGNILAGVAKVQLGGIPGQVRVALTLKKVGSPL